MSPFKPVENIALGSPSRLLRRSTTKEFSTRYQGVDDAKVCLANKRHPTPKPGKLYSTKFWNVSCFICLVVWKKLLEILRDVYKKQTKNVISPVWASRQIKVKYPDWSDSPPWTGPAAKKFQIPHLLFHSKISIHVVFKELLICWCFSWSICACFQVPHFTSATWTKRTDCDKAEKPTVKSLGTGFFQIPWILFKNTFRLMYT